MSEALYRYFENKSILQTSWDVRQIVFAVMRIKSVSLSCQIFIAGGKSEFIAELGPTSRCFAKSERKNWKRERA